VTSAYSAYAYYINGWCRGCGRKRNRDGSCANCDHWYNSPLLTAGGPLLIATVTLLAVGIHMLRPPAAVRRPSSSVPVALLSGTQTAANTFQRRPVGPYIAAPAGFTTALPPLRLPTAPAVPAGGGFSYYYNAQEADRERRQREQAQFMQLEELRRSVSEADAVVRADDAEQLARAARTMWQQQQRQSRPAMTTAAAVDAAMPMVRQFAPELPTDGNAAAPYNVFER